MVVLTSTRIANFVVPTNRWWRTLQFVPWSSIFGVDYLDSSALGMLLMLRDKLGGANKEVALVGVRGNVKQVLDIANFAKLFQIS